MSKSCSFYQFYETYSLFTSTLQEFTNSNPTYEEWLDLPDDLKAASLYVKYFPCIIASWKRASVEYVLDDDAVEVCLQHLQKNVEKIINDAKRYTSSYITKVTYNGMASIRRYAVNKKNAYEKEVSVYINSDNPESETDIFDTLTVEDTTVDFDESLFWMVVEDMSISTQSVVDYLINNKYTEKLITDYDKDEHTHDYIDRLISKGKIKNVTTRDEYENCLKEIYQNFVKAM